MGDVDVRDGSATVMGKGRRGRTVVFGSKTALDTLLRTQKIDSVRKLARGHIQCDLAKFDLHPELLNCPNGVVDLRTGKLQPHDPALLMTTITELKRRDHDKRAAS